MIVLALLLWNHAQRYMASDGNGVRNLFSLGAILLIPLARLGLAPSALEKLGLWLLFACLEISSI